MTLFDGRKTYSCYQADSAAFIYSDMRLEEMQYLPFPGANLPRFTLFKESSGALTSTHGAQNVPGEMQISGATGPDRKAVYLKGAIACVTGVGSARRMLKCSSFSRAFPLEQWRFTGQQNLNGVPICTDIAVNQYALPNAGKDEDAPGPYPLDRKITYHLMAASPRPLPQEQFDFTTYLRPGQTVQDYSGTQATVFAFNPKMGTLQRQHDIAAMTEEADQNDRLSVGSHSGLVLLIGFALSGLVLLWHKLPRKEI